MTEQERKLAEEQFKKYSTDGDEEKDIKNIGKNLDKMKKGPIKEIWEDVQKLWKFIMDPNASKIKKVSAIAALIYLISPIDAIPDIITVLGLTDDVAVIGIAIKMLHDELKKYNV